MTATKIKIEIKNWWTGSILFEYEKENNTLRETVLQAIKSCANLRSANLSGADLSGANLSGADLTPIKNDLFIVGLKNLNYLFL